MGAGRTGAVSVGCTHKMGPNRKCSASSCAVEPTVSPFSLFVFTITKMRKWTRLFLVLFQLHNFKDLLSECIDS